MNCQNKITRKKATLHFGSKFLKFNFVKYLQKSSKSLLKSSKKSTIIDYGNRKFITSESTMQREKFKDKLERNLFNRLCNCTKLFTPN